MPMVNVMTERILAIDSMSSGPERIEAECKCVADCIVTSKSGIKVIDKRRLAEFLEMKETCCFFSFHIFPECGCRVISNRICDFLPILAQKDVRAMEGLLCKRPEVLFTPYPSEFSSIAVSYLDRAWNSCYYDSEIVDLFLKLARKIQTKRDVPQEVSTKFQTWIWSRVGEQGRVVD
jgi:hypothetical protein